jgi:hypothetical protein
MRDQGVFEPGDLSGLDFQTWLAQIDDAASDEFLSNTLGQNTRLFYGNNQDL